MKYLFLSLFFVSLLSCSKDNEPTSENKPPTDFNLIAPLNNAAGIAHLAELKWQTATDPDGDAVTYTLYLDKNGSPATIVSSGLTNTNHTLSFLWKATLCTTGK